MAPKTEAQAASGFILPESFRGGLQIDSSGIEFGVQGLFGSVFFLLRAPFSSLLQSEYLVGRAWVQGLGFKF